MEARVNDVLIVLTEADPLTLPVEALVLEAEPNPRLSSSQAAVIGIDVQRELAAVGRIDVGDAVVTSGGATAFRKLIHAVTPRWGEGSERGKLLNATHACLALCEAHSLTSVALPVFSVGQRGYPVESCASIMLTEIVDFTFEDLTALARVVVYCQTPQSYATFAAELERQLRQLADET